jgi:hypothetical protein
MSTDSNTAAPLAPVSLCDHALKLAQQGTFIFPAPATGEKKGIYPGATTNRRRWGNTNDPATVRAYWLKHPDANIGLPTGKDNKIFVFEFDTPEGHEVDGATAVAELEAKHGKLPETLKSQSPSGSIHYYFNHPGFYVKSSAGEIAPGIDIKGDGGMVLAPPSNRPGKGEYRWLNELPPVDAPQWLLDLIKATATKSASTAQRPAVPIPPPPPGATPVEKAVHEAYHSVALMKKGRRNHELNDASFKLGILVGKDHLDEEKAIQLLLAACEANGSLAENARECHGTIDSGMSGGKREGRKVMKAFSDTLAAARVSAEEATLQPGQAPPPPVFDKAAPKPKTSTADTIVEKARYLFETESDLDNEPDLAWLAEKWIPERSTGIIYGWYGSGKSFIAFDLLLHLAYGLEEWHGIKLPGIPCDGLLIAREGAAGFKRRIKAFKKHHGITEKNDRLVIMRSPVNFGEPVGFEELKAAIKATGKKFGAVVVDTVGRALPGEDMFDPKSITRFMEHLQQIGELGEGVAIGVHHENKTGDVMGSAYFQLNSDFMFHVKRDGDPEKDPLLSGTISCVKQKDGEDGWSRAITYKFIATEQNGEGSLVVDSLTETAGAASKAAEKLTTKEGLALQALGEVLKTKGQLGGDIGGRSVTLDEWKEQCIRTGAVAQDANTWRDLGRRQEGLIAKGRIRVLDNRVRLIGDGVKGEAGNVIPMLTRPSNAVPMPPK